jgi:hypothetical protein
MKSLNEKTWRFIAKVLRFIGGAGCVVVFSWNLLLIAYYSITRPHIPQPIYDWTIQLKWSLSYPTYGTASENAFLIHLFNSFFIFFSILAASEAIRIYKLGGK